MVANDPLAHYHSRIVALGILEHVFFVYHDEDDDYPWYRFPIVAAIVAVWFYSPIWLYWLSLGTALVGWQELADSLFVDRYRSLEVLLWLVAIFGGGFSLYYKWQSWLTASRTERLTLVQRHLDSSDRVISELEKVLEAEGVSEVVKLIVAGTLKQERGIHTQLVTEVNKLRKML